MTWTRTAADWNRRCTVDSGTASAIPPEAAFAVVRAACEPYGRGLRYFAIPAVEFEASGERLTEPGDRLPGPDADLDGFLAAASARDRGWRLRVVEPLFTDYPLWNRVRETIAPLWSRVGTPVLPVASELILAADTELCAAEATRLNLVFVLSGSARLHDGDSVHELSRGDAAQLPAAGAAVVRAGSGCLLLRLRVPVDRRLPVTEAVKLLGRIAATEAAEEPIPELPFPPTVTGDELTAVPEVLRRPVFRPEYRDEAERLTRAWWAGRRSAAGLDPVPEPDEPPPLRPEQRVRLSAPILVSDGDEPDRRLWAVNGMAFTVAGPVPAAVLERLRAGTAEVRELCRDADGEDNGAEALLDRLRELRALDLVEETS